MTGPLTYVVEKLRLPSNLASRWVLVLPMKCTYISSGVILLFTGSLGSRCEGSREPVQNTSRNICRVFRCVARSLNAVVIVIMSERVSILKQSNQECFALQIHFIAQERNFHADSWCWNLNICTLTPWNIVKKYVHEVFPSL